MMLTQIKLNKKTYYSTLTEMKRTRINGIVNFPPEFEMIIDIRSVTSNKTFPASVIYSKIKSMEH